MVGISMLISHSIEFDAKYNLISVKEKSGRFEIVMLNVCSELNQKYLTFSKSLIEIKRYT